MSHTLLPASIMDKAHELKKQVGKTAANYLESDSPSLTCYMFKKQLMVKVQWLEPRGTHPVYVLLTICAPVYRTSPSPLPLRAPAIG